MQSDFADADPEDAYDDEDEADDKLDVLSRVVPSIVAERDDPHAEQTRVSARAAWAIGALDRLRTRRNRRVVDELLAALEAIS